MIENDTVRLLRECDAGIKMGVASINDVIDGINDRNFKNCVVMQRRADFPPLSPTSQTE